MNRHVNAIAGRLSLRAPQRRSLEILDRITELVPPKKSTDAAAALAAVRSEFPSVIDFERDFLSVRRLLSYLLKTMRRRCCGST